MATNRYRFVTIWDVDGSPAEVFRIIEDISSFPRWWPAVWLEVDEIRPPREDGAGRIVAVKTTGLLPYTLRWTSESTILEFPKRLVLEATGDFVGRGEWLFEERGTMTRITYVWEVLAEKPLLRHLSPILKPIFSANHRWAMRTGHGALRREIAARVRR
jgi:hypothetical protein